IRLVSEHGYLAIFVLMLLDSACVPFPSEVTLLFGGALTSTAFIGAGQELSLVAVVFWAMAGTLIGSWLAYGVGYAGGGPAVDRARVRRSLAGDRPGDPAGRVDHRRRRRRGARRVRVASLGPGASRVRGPRCPGGWVDEHVARVRGWRPSSSSRRTHRPS